jgi:hypothetical protein
MNCTGDPRLHRSSDSEHELVTVKALKLRLDGSCSFTDDASISYAASVIMGEWEREGDGNNAEKPETFRQIMRS